ncbi:thioesterase family protein [Kutzneria sp. NPDC052558]|uniref:thioesterase family protein n=1 Tax=Kutzneria sp. NPDC052558 TaxID=3364121 RepID=UPI0037CB932E
MSAGQAAAIRLFSAASAVRPLGDGTAIADLPSDWTVGTKPHGGFLLALLARAAVQVLEGSGSELLDPLAVSAQFLRAPSVGPVMLKTEVRKTGRTVVVVRVSLEQRGSACVEAMVTVGRLPEERPAWRDLPELPVLPPANAIDLGSLPNAVGVFKLARACEVLVDPQGAGFLERRTGDPLRLRMWVRPRGGEQPDPFFALVAGDIAMPLTFNLGRFGWSPTVQLTGLVRARPEPGWLRAQVESRAVHGQWFDQDATILDASGRLVCQARQLALSPQETNSS